MKKPRPAPKFGPPEHTKWKKGCPSPNPEGARARLPMHYFAQAMKAKLADLDPRTKKTGAERLAEVAFRRGLQGSFKHMELALSYAEGKPAQKLDLNVSTPPRDERLIPFSDHELNRIQVLMLKDVLTAEEQAELGVLTWKYGRGATGKEITVSANAAD